MATQSADARALEKSVLAVFNTKLAAKVNAFKAANSGVRLLDSYYCTTPLHSSLYSLPYKPLHRLFRLESDSLLTPHAQVKTWLWDSNAAFTTYLNAPTQFGFSDATTFGQPKSFWGCGPSTTSR
jgi:hypothetical protein